MNPLQSLNLKFHETMLSLGFVSGHDFVVAVSGGADSMALALLLQEWCENNQSKLIAVTIDHGLRVEAQHEVKQVQEWLSSRGIATKILTLKNIQKENSLQENARLARYEALFSFCEKEEKQHLFVAHHAKDQIETLLHRLISGSGLDGLKAMLPVTQTKQGLKIMRPLLGFEKQELVDFLTSQNQTWIEDPSNTNEDFTRIRMRKIAEELQEEGLSAKRIEKLSSRLHRITEALDFYVEKAFESFCQCYPAGYIEISKIDFFQLPSEIRLRLMIDVLQKVSGQTEDYLRLKKIETLVFDLQDKDKKTVMGCVVDAGHESFIRVFPEVPKQLVFENNLWDNRFIIELKEGQTARLFEAGDVAFFKEKAQGSVWQAIPVEMRACLPVFSSEKAGFIGNPLLGYAAEDVKIRHRFSCFYAQKG